MILLSRIKRNSSNKDINVIHMASLSIVRDNKTFFKIIGTLIIAGEAIKIY